MRDRQFRWFSVLVLVGACLGLLALPFSTRAQVTNPKPAGAIVGASVAADVSNVGTFEIQSPATGSGILIFSIQADVAAVYVATIDNASVITSAAVTQTQSFRFGSTTGTAVVRTGLCSSAPPTEGGWFLRTLAGAVYMVPAPIFVPPGKFFTVRRVAVNTALAITVGYYELP